MSHVKNLQSFEKLLGICTGYGGTYNPGQQNLQVSALATLMRQAKESLTTVNAAKTAYDNASNQREVTFKDIRTLSTRILCGLKATGALQQTVSDARVMVRKINGIRKVNRKPLPSDEAQSVKGRTANGLDYASQVFHFSKLLETLAAESRYQPNEPELQVKGLTGKLAAMQAGNSAVTLAEVDLNKARLLRDGVLYKDSGNLYDTAKAVKQYAKSVFGTQSSQYRKVGELSFTKP